MPQVLGLILVLLSPFALVGCGILALVRVIRFPVRKAAQDVHGNVVIPAQEV